MTTRIFIDGAAGTTGLEIRDRLNGRDEFELLVLDDERRKDESARKDALHAADIAILCLPDDAAKDAVKLAAGSNTRIIDASSAHRVAEGWTYGFPELIGHDRIAEAQFVSNPGCYPTGFLALVAPLVNEGILRSDWHYAINAVSGFSGGGNAMIGEFEADADLAFRAYALAFGHKHLPEMKKYAGLDHAPLFSPGVIPAFRGMMVDVTMPVAALHDGADGFDAIHNAWAKRYNGEVVIISEPQTILDLRRSQEASDFLTVSKLMSADRTQVRLSAWLDNLGKGASGAAIQNLNIMCGLPETTGLKLKRFAA